MEVCSQITRTVSSAYLLFSFYAGNTALHLAADFGDSLETLTLLLNVPDIDTTLKNASGETAHEIAKRCSKFAYLFEQKPNR